MMEILGNLFLLVGALFLFSAGLGVLRMPDTYNRIQTGTKATTLGTIMILAGIAMLHPMWAFKLLILVFFVMLTNPVSSHALARAAHSCGLCESSIAGLDSLAESDAESAASELATEGDDA